MDKPRQSEVDQCIEDILFGDLTKEQKQRLAEKLQFDWQDNDWDSLDDWPG